MSEGKNIGKENTNIKMSDENLPTSIYVGENVDEVNLINKDLEMEARKKVANDKESQEIYERAETRPRLHFDAENDPMFKQVKVNSEAAKGLVDNGYEGCVTLESTPEKIGEEVKKCEVKGYRDKKNFQCTKDVKAVCENNNENQIKPLKARHFKREIEDNRDGLLKVSDYSNNRVRVWVEDGARKIDCIWYRDRFKVELEPGYELIDLKMELTWLDDAIIVNAGKGNHGTSYSFFTLGHLWNIQYTNFKKCEQKGDSHRGKIFNLFDFTQVYKTTFNQNKMKSFFFLDFYHLVGGSGDFEIILSGKMKRVCDVKVIENEYCDSGFSKDDKDAVKERAYYCTDNRQPLRRKVEGSQTEHYRNCWQYKEDWIVWSAPYFIEDGACDELREQGCQQQDTGVCIDQGSGFCEKANISFSCGIYASSEQVDLCGSSLPCQGGECTNDLVETYDATDDFKKAASAMAMADALVDEFDVESLKLFKGQVANCDDKGGLGYSNCCDGDGWGQDLGLISCRDNEKLLMQSMKDGKAQYIGKDKRGQFPLEYTRKKYCEFPSKIGFLIVKGGFEQLGISWGNYNNPNCEGLTLEQFEKVDFNKIDLSPYFDDVMEKASNEMNSKMPSGDLAVERLKQQIENLQ